MITQFRYVWAAALGVMLVLAGCASSHVVGRRAVGLRAVGPALTLTIVESSPNFRAEAHDMAGMRDEVVKFLSTQGLDRNGDYYVRVDLPPRNPGDPAEWAIVKLTNSNTSTYSLLGADTAIGPDDYYPFSFAYGSPYYDSYNYWGPDYGYLGPTYVNPAFYRPTPRRPDGDRHRDRNPNDQPRGTRDHQPNDHTRNWNGRDRNRDHDGRKDSGNWRDHRPDRPETPNRPGGDRPRWSAGSGIRPESAPPASAGGFSRAAPSQNYAPASHASSPVPSYSLPPPPPPPASAPVRSDPATNRNDRNHRNDRNQER